ncbi:MCE family protein [Mycolicibacterium neoaurum]|uniref:MCE family protein n=1 Tax=Mycolicibacterium neoaurum TaxID=1795 RepID=UPI00248BA135|nr:MCE family protein [Mycolicibacterium neoaurum]MDO3402963.1 MCE family protein [Mycolicibacterium neoaurum]WBP93672.1 MCE family protein [Mycolicibacterium neoaurum]WBS07551.1 MCE family protein [Mycolicibacterium neoaurum]
MRLSISRALSCVAVLGAVATVSACEWRGLNSLPMPGTEGGGPGSFEIRAELPDVGYIQENSRVRVGDANVGTITKIERVDWHALVTMSLNENVELPANSTAKIGQTSLLGSLHVELAPPTDAPPEGRLHEGSLIPLENGGAYPGTDKTLSALSLVLNGGGIGEVQDITMSFATAFAGREADLRNLIGQLDQFMTRLDQQTTDIIAATESFNGLVSQVADQKPVLDRAIHTIPDALAVLAEQRQSLVDAADSFGKFSALATDTVNRSKDSLIAELHQVGPVLRSLADAGPALTRSLDFIGTFPWPKGPLDKWIRGDYANITAIADLTLSRIDNNLFSGTRFEGELTELEMQWGRTIGQLPSPYTASNPLVAPYRLDQGP